jgi:hypothetical protein
MEHCHVKVARLGQGRWTWSIDDLTDRHGHWQGTAATKQLAEFAVDIVLTALGGQATPIPTAEAV